MASAIIFGGSGFIGSHLTNYLLEQAGFEAVTLADVATPARPLRDGVKFVRCDVREPIDDSLGPADLVVNLAAVHRTPGHSDAEYHETNESGAFNVTDFAARLDIKRIWFTSSIAVYGPDEEPKTEESEPQPISAYGKSKLAAERIHDDWAKTTPGRTLVVARPATVFGQGESGNFTRLAAAMKKHVFFYPGRRDTRKACGYVGDLGPTFTFMEESANPSVTYNFAYPEPPTIEEVCEAFAEVGAMRAPRVTVPARLLLSAGSLLTRIGVSAVNPERINKLMHSTNVRGSLLADQDYRWRYDLRGGLAEWYASSPARRFD